MRGTNSEEALVERNLRLGLGEVLEGRNLS
jgi:hypothetical protein